MMRMLYPLLLVYKGGVWAAPLTETDMQLVLVGTGGCAGDDLRGRRFFFLFPYFLTLPCFALIAGFGVESMDHDLTVTVNQPIKGSRVGVSHTPPFQWPFFLSSASLYLVKLVEHDVIHVIHWRTRTMLPRCCGQPNGGRRGRSLPTIQLSTLGQTTIECK